MPTNVPSNAPTIAPSKVPSCVPSNTPSKVPSNVPTLFPTRTETPTNSPSRCPSFVPTHVPITIYDDKIRVTSVFGTGRAATTDSPGLIGEVNTPIDTVYSVDENYLYITDLNGGGLIRKLVVMNEGVTSSDVSLTVLYGVKTVFTGTIAKSSHIC
jgi:hypothetical protein